MGIAKLGNNPIDIEEANRIYNDAQLMFRRYEPNSSIEKVEVGANCTIDPVNFAVKSNERIVSVLRGSIFDRDSILYDMTRLSALIGLMGEVIVDLDVAHDKLNYALTRLEAKMYNKYTALIYTTSDHPLKDVPKTKLTKEHIQSMVLNDEEVIKLQEALTEADRNKKRAKKAQDGMIDLENEFKKILEHGERAQ